jgi:hypothetical protein
MTTHSVNTATKPVDLTLEICSADSTSTVYYQADEERIRRTLRLFSTPHLLTQPQLVLTSEHGVNVVPIRGIDMVLARMSGQSPPILPLIFPPGLLDITEVGEDVPDDDFGEEHYAPPPLVSHVEVHTLGGWVVALKILVSTGGTLHDQRQWFAHLMNQPVVTFRLRSGGIGLINTNNVTRVRAYPTPDGIPETSLPMDLQRWTPSRINPTKLTEGSHS